ncbi:MAG: ADYC domain-containing protein [Burkholderiaceae bacterium]
MPLPRTTRSARHQFAAIALFAVAQAVSAQGPRLGVEGTEFVVTMPDGRVLRSGQLVGATLTVEAGGRPIEILIESVEDDDEAVGGRVVLHQLRVRNDGGQWAPLCKPDAKGRNLGFPLPDGRGGFDLTCTGGAAGKCVRWGYRPWEEHPGGPPLRDLHRACIHMVRADYGGDGGANTRDGTLIDLQDRFGIQAFEPPGAMTFEAAWGVNGAVCVAHTRIAAVVTLEQLAERYPKLRGRLGVPACSAERALGEPAALLFNRSLP